VSDATAAFDPSKFDLGKLNAIAGVHPFIQKQLERALSLKTREFKFLEGMELRHMKSGGIYLLTGTPHEYVIEATREPAYAYLMPDGRTCIRSQAEMESEGRFEVAEEGAAAAWLAVPGNYEAWLEKAGASEKKPEPPHSVLVEGMTTFEELMAFCELNKGQRTEERPNTNYYKGREVTVMSYDCIMVQQSDGQVVPFERGTNDLLLESLGQFFVSRTALGVPA
jgi:hypothetical protein